MADFRKRRPPQAQRRGEAPKKRQVATAWNQQAGWYDQRQQAKGDDLHSTVAIPAVIRQLDALPGQRVLDCCCGTGVLGRHLAELGVATLGLDASPAMLAHAQERAGKLESYRQGDARACAQVLQGERFDHAALVLALQDLDPLKGVLEGLRSLVAPEGRLVIALTHPCFRVPKHSDWGWDPARSISYRRIDGYLIPKKLPIVTHPGRPDDGASTTSFHRPLSLYINALGAAGWAVVACEEPTSPRRGSRGVRSEAEDLAAREVPMFLLLTAERRGGAA